MSKQLPTGHMIIKNEDRFIWYAISSTIDKLSQLLIFDTGSQDNTVRIIQSFRSPKIIFEQKENINSSQMAYLRQEQIERTKTDWIWIIDGDEIYPKKTSGEVLDYILRDTVQYEGGAVRRFDLLGDIYHYQSEKIGEYNLFGQKGHLVLRLLNKKKLPGLNIKGVYPNEAYYDKGGILISDHPKEKFFITENRLFHAMYLKRSSLGSSLSNTLHRNKFKIEKGYLFRNNQQLPEVFFQDHLSNNEDVIKKRGITYETLSIFITPLKKLKRLIWKKI